jgi:hypothetical protein
MSTEREKVVYENRVLAKTRVFGFGKKLQEDWRDCCGQGEEPPNWSNDDGRTTLDLAEVMPDEGWNWTGNWKIEIGTDCDRRGWQYATKYERFVQNKGRVDRGYAKRTDKYSRRRWVRAMQRSEGITYSVGAGQQRGRSAGPTRVWSTKEVQRGLQKIDAAVIRVEQHVQLIGGHQDSRNLREQMRKERKILKQFISKAQAGMNSIRQQQTEGKEMKISKAEFNKLNREFERLSEKYTKVKQGAELQERLHQVPEDRGSVDFGSTGGSSSVVVGDSQPSEQEVLGPRLRRVGTGEFQHRDEQEQQIWQQVRLSP